MDDEIRDAVDYFNQKFHKYGEDGIRAKHFNTILNLSTQYLALTKEDGVPEERNEDFNANNFKEVFNRNLGFNEARSLLLPILLKSRRECEKKDQRIAELENLNKFLIDETERLTIEQNRSNTLISKVDIIKVIKEFGSPMNGVTWDYWVENIAEKIANNYKHSLAKVRKG